MENSLEHATHKTLEFLCSTKIIKYSKYKRQKNKIPRKDILEFTNNNLMMKNTKLKDKNSYVNLGDRVWGLSLRIIRLYELWSLGKVRKKFQRKSWRRLIEFKYDYTFLWLCFRRVNIFKLIANLLEWEIKQYS